MSRIPGADCGVRAIIYQPGEGIPGTAPATDLPLPAGTEPHLLLDEYAIAAATNVERVVLPPVRDPARPNPVVNATADRCFQPFLSVLRCPQSGRFRLWYGAWRDDRRPDRSQLALLESEDGIHVCRPHRVCDTPEIQFGSQVLDRGTRHPDPAARYLYSYWLAGGLRLLVSADGLHWRPLRDGVLLPHNHDINNVTWDPARRTYVATISSYTTGPVWSGQRRTTLLSFSDDLLHWEPPWTVLAADDRLDEGDTQFYAMNGYLTRGALRISMVKVLRDDLRATGTEPGSFGRAHTSLAWSRDGRTWVRDRTPFFEPDDDPRAWDHAHAWIDQQLQVGDDLYLYYGGYRQGHKMNRFDERQIGLVTLPRDRYVARRAATQAPGRLTTVPIRLAAAPATLSVNANARGGSVRVQVRAVDDGQVLPGLSFAECVPLCADALREDIRWREVRLASAAGHTVQFEFDLHHADLFSFAFSPTAPLPAG